MATKQSTTFEVANVKEGTPYTTKLTSVPVQISSRVGEKLNFEAFSNQPLLAGNTTSNALIDLVQCSFANHIPLVLTPDAIWTTIAQGVANHINLNTEKLRKKLVSWQGKREIFIERNDFVKSSPENDWEGLFTEFSNKVEENVGEKVYDYVNNEFSTTTALEAAAHAITVMGAFKEFFQYTCGTMCGIPRITLEGTTQDWEKMLVSVDNLVLLDADLHPWINQVKLILEQFANASQGIVDRTWWNSFFKENNMSGGPYINGHVVKLFPYLRGSKNLFLNSSLDKDPSDWSSITGDQFPTSVAKAPVLWKYYNQEFNLEFIAGIVGIGYSEKENLVRPSFGWAVAEKE